MKKNEGGGTESIPSEAILEQTKRLATSPLFCSSKRMVRFLEVIIEAKLNGNYGELKETSLGVSVFGRQSDYDPQLDSIVRVEARRLRMKLAQYYQRYGEGDEVIISVPTGTYVPSFELREIVQPADVVAVAEPVRVEASVPVRGRRIALLFGGIFLIGCGVAIGWFWQTKNYRGALRISSQPATSYTGFEFDPAISTDGKQLAFVWDGNSGRFNLYTRLLEVGSPVRVTSGPGHDLHPAWSSDGQYLAFIRVTLTGRDLMVVPSLGGTERRVLKMIPSEVGTWRADPTQMYGKPGPAWFPENDRLIITDYFDSRFGGALYVVSLDGRTLTRITSPEPGSHDFGPAVSPNGKLLAYIHYTSASTSDLWVVGIDGRGGRQLTRDRKDLRGISWLPDSRHLAFSSNRGGGYGVWTTSISGEEATALALNGYRITEPSISHDGSLLAYTDSTRNSNVWRVKLKTASPGREPELASSAEAEMVIASSRQSYCAQFSPDGKHIAFISDRSGTFEIWVSRSDGSEPVQLTRFRGPLVGSPRWSPDGKWIAFDAHLEPHAAIYLISSAGTGLRRLNQDAFEERMPSWSKDGKWLYISSNRGGKVQLWKAPIDGGPPQRLSNNIAFTSRESPDGESVYFTSLGAGLWRVSSKGDAEVQVPELRNYHAGLHFALNASGIFLVNQETSRNIIFLSFATRRVRAIAHMTRPMVIDTPSLDVAPDGSQLIYSQIDIATSDIMLAKDWR